MLCFVSNEWRLIRRPTFEANLWPRPLRFKFSLLPVTQPFETVFQKLIFEALNVFPSLFASSFHAAFSRKQKLVEVRPMSSRGLSTSGLYSVAGAIPDLRPSLDSDRTTMITGRGFVYGSGIRFQR